MFIMPKAYGKNGKKENEFGEHQLAIAARYKKNPS